MNENKFNKTIEYNLNNSDYIDSAFKRIPTNAIINKSKCGIGGTTLELKDNRSSIIIVPNISIIESKKIDFPELQGVHSGIRNEEIELYIKTSLKEKKNIKLLVTPESLKRLIKIIYILGIDVYEEFFILFDEIHSVVTEGIYRDRISNAFEYFFYFKNKALISATPLEFSHPQFNEFDYHKINISSEDQIVNVINTNNVVKMVANLLNRNLQSNENYHIFFNSVTRINDIVNLLTNKDVSIHCANEVKNKHSLRDNMKFLKEPIPFTTSKYNFYTTKYFEGWDLFDENCNLIYVSDVYLANTCLDIKSKIKQAFGRLRKNKAKNLFHISNIRNIYANKSDQEIEKSVIRNTNSMIQTYNKAVQEESSYLIESLCDRIKDKSIVNDKGLAEYNYFKIDSNIHFEKSLNQFNNLKTLAQSWTQAGFIAKVADFKVYLSENEKKTLHTGRISKNGRLEIISKKLLSFQTVGQIINFDCLEEESYYQNNFKEEYNFFKLLGYDRMKSFNFNYTSIKKEFQKQKLNRDIIEPIKLRLSKEFKSNIFYSNDLITEKLDKYYKEFNYNYKANPFHITRFFKCKSVKKSIDNIDKRGYLLECML